MKYLVREDFQLDIGNPDPVEIAAGSVFIPAETNVGQNVVTSLVLAGKIERIKPEAAEAPTKAKKSK